MRSRVAFAILALVASCLGAGAQTGSVKSPATLNTEINTLWPDQQNGLITPFSARQTLLDLVASNCNLFATVSCVGGANITGTPSVGYVPVGTGAAAVWGNAIQNGASSSNTIYSAIFPGVTFQDTWSAAVTIPNGTVRTGTNAVSGYFDNDAPSSGGTNAVALFGVGRVTRDNGAGWGINTLLQDAATRTVGTATGRILKNEFDYNIMNPATVVQGVSVSGNSLAQPASAVGFQCASLGTGIYWPICIQSVDVGRYFADIGAVATSANSASQIVGFNWYDAGPTKQSISLQATGGFMSISGTTGFAGLSITGGSVYTNAMIAKTAAPTVAAAQIGYGSTTAANTNCGTLAGSAGCVVINVAGTTRYVPYY